VIDQSRLAAYELLKSVRVEDSYANIAWPRILKSHELMGRDAAFATDLAYGTLRWQGRYDAIAQVCAARPWEQVDPELRDVIRLGIHQLVAMRVPDHAAVDSSCELARSIGYHDKGRIGFVNGLLRSVSRKNPHEWDEELSSQRSGKDSLATLTSHPQWIVDAIADALTVHYQAEVSEEQLRAALEANNVPSRPTLALRGASTERDPGLSAGRWLPGAAVVDAGIPAEIPAVATGQAIVQDEGSQLVVAALLSVPVDPPESAWLDMCAGPGGKAVLLADAATESGINFQAVELHEHRAKLVGQLIGDGSSAEVVTADATTRPWGSRFFDRVLLDAPCTGIGALRRRPEARWRRSPSDLVNLVKVQRRLLDVGLSSLRSGGVLGYVTCSPHVSETLDVIEEVLVHRDDVEVLDARECLSHVPDLGPGPHLQLWPHIHGTDAMHLSLLRRR
jgi:16S rRNA (cytosine967-C5)-methyltransferase